MAMIRQNLTDLVTFDTAPAIEEKGQYPRAINIAVVPSGVAVAAKGLDDRRQTAPAKSLPFGVILTLPAKLGDPSRSARSPV